MLEEEPDQSSVRDEEQVWGVTSLFLFNAPGSQEANSFTESLSSPTRWLLLLLCCNSPQFADLGSAASSTKQFEQPASLGFLKALLLLADVWPDEDDSALSHIIFPLALM
jgi:hypothetical protein